MSAVDGLVFPSEFDVLVLSDPVVEVVGFPVHHAYVEMLWLPVVGPSTTRLLRRLGSWAAACPAGVTVQLAEVACWLDVGPSVGPSSTVQRSLRRLVRFGLASWNGRLAVRSVVPPLGASSPPAEPGLAGRSPSSAGRPPGGVGRRPLPTRSPTTSLRSLAQQAEVR